MLANNLFIVTFKEKWFLDFVAILQLSLRNYKEIMSLNIFICVCVLLSGYAILADINYMWIFFIPSGYMFCVKLIFVNLKDSLQIHNKV